MRGRLLMTTVVAVLAAASVASAGPERSGVFTVTVTVSVSGGGSVKSDPSGPIDCGSACTTELAVGSAFALRAFPNGGRQLNGWDGDCSGRAPTCDVVVEGPTTIAAAFGATTSPVPPVPLDVTRSDGGSVVGDPAGFIDCGTACSTAWPDGGELTLTARPASGYRFDGWSGSCSGTGSCRLAMTEERDVTALFRREQISSGTSQLTVTNRNPPGSGSTTGTVDVTIGDGESSECDQAMCTYTGITRGSVVVITPNGTLRSWEGGCVGAAETCKLVVTGNTGVTVAFRAGGPTPSFGVNVSRSGRGRVTSVPRGIDCGPSTTCAAAFGTTTRVRLSAAASSGWSFGGWKGDCGGAADCAVVADTTRAVTAVFRLARRTLRVELAGRGRGTVRSAPAGISCPPDCEFPFPVGETVALTAAPDAGSLFAGWTGACTGSTCSLQLGQDAAARALFERCAALDFAGFTARSLRRPRRVAMALRLTGRAVVGTALLRGKRVVLRGARRSLPIGTQALTLRIPARVRAGSYLVRLTVTDPCGGTQSRRQAVRLR